MKNNKHNKSNKNNKNNKEKLFLDLVDRDLPRFFELDENITNKSKEKRVFNDKERNHLILVLAQNRNLWKWIDKIYSENKYEYYKAYKDTFFYDTPLKNGYSTKTKEYINKLAGIDNWCRINKTEEPLLKIIQKEHKKLYSRFKLNLDEFNLDGFISKALSEIDKKYKHASKVYLEKHNKVEEIIAVTLYLATVYQVHLEGFLWRRIMDTYVEDMFTGLKTKISANEILKEVDKKEMEKNIEHFLEFDYKLLKDCKTLNDLYNIIMLEQTEKARKTASIMCNDSFEVASITEVSKMLIENILAGEDSPYLLDKEVITDMFLEESTKAMHDKVANTEFSKYLNYLYASLKAVGLEKEVLFDMPIDIEMVESAILVVTSCELEKYATDKRKVTNELRLKFLITLTNMALLENYKSILPDYFGKEDEHNILEIEKLNNEISEKDIEIARLKQKISDLEKTKEKQIESILEDLDKSNKIINRLTQELEESKENQEEFIAMKEYIYRSSIDESEIAMTLELDEVTIEDKINYINERKIAVFGGHPNWVNKLKKLIPNAMYIDTNAMSSRRFNRLDKYDLLVICNLFISHGLAWKVSEAIKNVKSKKVVIIDDINTDLIIGKMYDSIKSYEENENKLY